MEKICGRAGCGRLATHGIKIKLWARGFLRGSHSPIEIYFDFGLCLPHAIEDAADGPRLISDVEGRDRITAAMIDLGKAVPDFDTCEAEPVPRRRPEEFFRAARSSQRTIVK